MTGATVAEAVTLRGAAVRTHGGEATVRITPGETGFVFVRDDTGERVPADLAHRVPVANSTALGLNGRPVVVFVEHVLSALVGLGYSAAEIHVDGPEIPLLDGSALPFAHALAQAGRRPAPAAEPLVVRRPVWLVGERRCLGALPHDGWALEYCFEHPHPMTPWDYVHLDETTDYATQVAPARTFATVEEIEALAARGLVKGGSSDNLLIVYPDRFSAPLRLPNEFATHKALDLIGDLALLGRPLRGRLVAWRTGHADNHELAALLSAFAEA